MTRRALILAALLLSFTVWLDSAARPTPPPARLALAELPLQIENWQGRSEPPLDPKVLKVLGAEDYVNRTYLRANGREAVGLYIGYHAAQRHDASIHSPMNCLPGAGWLPLNAGSTKLALPDDQSAVVNNVTIVKGEQRQLVLYWYQSQGRTIANEYESKAYLFVDAIRRGRTDAALVRIIAPITNDSEVVALASGREFAAALLPLLDAYVPR
jgi:EpsI family protein